MSRRPWSRRVVGVGAFLGCLLASSCGSAGPKLHPVRGQVLFQDKPAEGALVVFHPVRADAEAVPPSGIVGADGSFTLASRTPSDGAPAGEYVVAIVWFDKEIQIDANNAELKNRLPAHYGDAKTSPLRAQVKEGPNQLEPFRLKN